LLRELPADIGRSEPGQELLVERRELAVVAGHRIAGKTASNPPELSRCSETETRL